MQGSVTRGTPETYGTLLVWPPGPEGLAFCHQAAKRYVAILCMQLHSRLQVRPCPHTLPCHAWTAAAIDFRSLGRPASLRLLSQQFDSST
jgi:hypothetical protein